MWSSFVGHQVLGPFLYYWGLDRNTPICCDVWCAGHKQECTADSHRKKKKKKRRKKKGKRIKQKTKVPSRRVTGQDESCFYSIRYWIIFLSIVFLTTCIKIWWAVGYAFYLGFWGFWYVAFLNPVPIRIPGSWLECNMAYLENRVLWTFIIVALPISICTDTHYCVCYSTIVLLLVNGNGLQYPRMILILIWICETIFLAGLVWD